MLSKYTSNPGKTHWNALTHILRYIRGTLGFRITYGGKHNDLAPIGYVDADYAGDLDDRRSCAGHVFVQAGGPMVWGSQYQPTVALSTTEAEYMALTRAMKQILWMYVAMDEVGYSQPKPAILYNDNCYKNNHDTSRACHSYTSFFVLPQSSSCHGPRHPCVHPDQGPSLIRI